MGKQKPNLFSKILKKASNVYDETVHDWDKLVGKMYKSAKKPVAKKTGSTTRKKTTRKK